MSWPLAKFKDVATVVTGSTPQKKDDNYGGTIPFVTPGDLGSGAEISDAKVTLTNAGSQSGRLLPANTVLVCCIGATIGKTGIAAVPLVTNQQINSLIFNESEVFPKYGYYFCTTITPFLRHRSTSTTMPIVNKSSFSEIEMPLPPLTEQKRIAAILDKADAIRRKRQQAIQLADEFLRAVFLDMFGDPGRNKMSWPVMKISDAMNLGYVLEVQDGNHGNDHPKVVDFVNEGYPFIAANVVRNGKIEFDKCDYLDASWLSKLRIGFAKPNDVLISHKGSLGFTAVLDETFDTYIFSPQTTYYRVDREKLHPIYLKGYFDSSFFQALFKKEGIQSTRAYIGITRQKDLPLLVPPVEHQQRYVQIAAKHARRIDLLNECRDAASELFGSLSQRAFAEGV